MLAVAFEALIDYSQLLLEAANQVVSRAHQELLAAEASAPQVANDFVQLRRVGEIVLRNSLIGQLARPLILALSVFPSARRPVLSLRLLPSLIELTRSLDSFVSLCFAFFA